MLGGPLGPDSCCALQLKPSGLKTLSPAKKSLAPYTNGPGRAGTLWYAIVLPGVRFGNRPSGQDFGRILVAVPEPDFCGLLHPPDFTRGLFYNKIELTSRSGWGFAPGGHDLLARAFFKTDPSGRVFGAKFG